MNTLRLGYKEKELLKVYDHFRLYRMTEHEPLLEIQLPSVKAKSILIFKGYAFEEIITNLHSAFLTS